MITKAIEKSFHIIKKRGWDRGYWAFDVHDTIVKSNYQHGNIPTDFYPHAKEVLRDISKRKDIEMLLFTCSHPEEIQKYIEFFKSHDIHFKFANENPEIGNITYGCYDKKFYFNVLFEDKAGFDPENDWIQVKNILAQYPEDWIYNL